MKKGIPLIRAKRPRTAPSLPVLLALAASVQPLSCAGARLDPEDRAEQRDPVPGADREPAVTDRLLFVSTGGDDANPGTAEAPLRHVATAAARATPGTTVLIAGGTYAEQVVTVRGGLPGEDLVFRSHQGTAVIDGSGLPWAIAGNQNQGLVELGHPHVRLEGLAIRNSKNSGVILAADHLAVRDCRISGAARHAISTNTEFQEAASGQMIRDVTIAGNLITDATRSGHGQAISLIADGFAITGNELTGNHNIAIDVWLGARHGEVSDNLVHDNALAGIFVDGASYVRIHRNRVFRGRQDGILLSSEDGRYPTHHVWVYNNLVYENAKNGLGIWDPDSGAKEVLFAHNTLVGNFRSFYFGASESTARVWNNLACGSSRHFQDDGQGSRIEARHNVFTGRCTGFVSPEGGDFRLGALSGAIDRGGTLPALSDDRGNVFAIDTDFAGAARLAGEAPDAGAYEYPAGR